MATCQFIVLLWYNVAITKYCSVAANWSLHIIIIYLLWNQNKNFQILFGGYKVLVYN